MSRKRRGHFCWCCGRVRPNERFSGRNHGRHLCRDCARLPAEEREFRQGERDIERLLRGSFYVPRRLRPQFDRFLEHPNARVRDLAREILEEQARDAEERRRIFAEERAAEEAAAASYPGPDESSELDDAKREYGDDDPF
jgi:hypothetical protein